MDSQTMTGGNLDENADTGNESATSSDRMSEIMLTESDTEEDY